MNSANKTLIVAIFLAMAQISAQAAGPVPINQLNMDAVPNLDREAVRRVQTLLHDKGVDPGPIDGINGSRTAAAIKSYQERYGIKSTGAINNQTLFALGAVDLAAQANE